MSTEVLPAIRPTQCAWNRAPLVGQKRPLQPKHVWSIRGRLEVAARPRAVQHGGRQQLRGCDLVAATGSQPSRRTLRASRFSIFRGLDRRRWPDWDPAWPQARRKRSETVSP